MFLSCSTVTRSGEGAESSRTIGFEIRVGKVEGKNSDKYGKERKEREENLRREEKKMVGYGRTCSSGAVVTLEDDGSTKE